MKKSSYFISKDTTSGEVVYLEYNKDGYKVSPKAKKEDAIEVNKIIFVSPTLTEKLLKNNTIVNYRLWIKGPKYNEIVKIINNYYKVNILEVNKKTIKKNLFVDYPNEFDWPNIKNEPIYSGGCKGTIDHIGILVDGTVVPCCLDSEGIINLGNIYKKSLEEIINSNKFIQIKESFKQNKRVHPLCKTCNFYQKNSCK